MDADGRELEQRVVTGTDSLPAVPEGGKLKRVPISRIFDNEAFGYTTITVERPLRDEAAIRALAAPDPHAELRHVTDAVSTIRKALAGHVPLI